MNRPSVTCRPGRPVVPCARHLPTPSRRAPGVRVGSAQRGLRHHCLTEPVSAGSSKCGVPSAAIIRGAQDVGKVSASRVARTLYKRIMSRTVLEPYNGVGLPFGKQDWGTAYRAARRARSRLCPVSMHPQRYRQPPLSGVVGIAPRIKVLFLQSLGPQVKPLGWGIDESRSTRTGPIK